MQRWVLVGVLGAVGFAVPGSFTAQPRGGKPGSWHSSYEAGRAAARQSGKPLMVVFRCER